MCERTKWKYLSIGMIIGLLLANRVPERVASAARAKVSQGYYGFLTWKAEREAKRKQDK